MAKKSVYDHVEQGKWETVTQTFDLACCDCHLVHEVALRVRKIGGRNRFQVRFKRNGPATGGLRK